MHNKLAVVLFACVTAVICNDIQVGSNHGRKMFNEMIQASPAIWKQVQKITINTTNNEVISAVDVSDRRAEKNGVAKIVEGGVGQKNVTIELQSPSVFRGFDFQVVVYAIQEDVAGQDNAQYPAVIPNDTKVNASAKPNDKDTVTSKDIKPIVPANADQQTLENKQGKPSAPVTTADQTRNTRSAQKLQDTDLIVEYVNQEQTKLKANASMDTHKVNAQVVTTHKMDTQKDNAQEVTTHKMDTQKVNAQEVTTDSAHNINTQKLNTQEITTDNSQIINKQAVNAQEVTTHNTQKMDTQKVNAQEVTTDSAHKINTQKLNTQEITTDSSQKINKQEVNAQAITTNSAHKMDTQKVNGQEVTTDIAQKINTQKVNGHEITTESAQTIFPQKVTTDCDHKPNVPTTTSTVKPDRFVKQSTPVNNDSHTQTDKYHTDDLQQNQEKDIPQLHHFNVKVHKEDHSTTTPCTSTAAVAATTTTTENIRDQTKQQNLDSISKDLGHKVVFG